MQRLLTCSTVPFLQEKQYLRLQSSQWIRQGRLAAVVMRISNRALSGQRLPCNGCRGIDGVSLFHLSLISTRTSMNSHTMLIINSSSFISLWYLVRHSDCSKCLATPSFQLPQHQNQKHILADLKRDTCNMWSLRKSVQQTEPHWCVRLFVVVWSDV